jgi:hypothetical protein
VKGGEGFANFAGTPRVYVEVDTLTSFKLNCFDLSVACADLRERAATGGISTGLNSPLALSPAGPMTGNPITQ